MGSLSIVSSILRQEISHFERVWELLQFPQSKREIQPVSYTFTDDEIIERKVFDWINFGGIEFKCDLRID